MRVSVICPTYNRSGLLVEAIESFCQQDYPDKELIVVNDGSTGNHAIRFGSLKIANTNDNIKFFTRLNRGQSAAQNFGIAASTGDLICTLDDDDLLFPSNSLSIRSQMFENNSGLEYVWTSAQEFGSSNKVVNGHKKDAQEEWRRDDIYVNSMMWKKSIFEKIGGYWFDENLTSNEDWDFKVRCLLNCNYDFLDVVTTKHRVHPEMRSSIHRASGELGQNENKFREKLRLKYPGVFNG